jgi:hypothetical protein
VLLSLPALLEGWARRPKQITTWFTAEQLAFLQWLFNGAGDSHRKVKENEGRVHMVQRFNVSTVGDPFSNRLVLSQKQIKSWTSAQAAKMRHRVFETVVNNAVSEVSAGLILDGEGGEGGEGGGGGAGEKSRGGDEGGDDDRPPAGLDVCSPATVEAGTVQGSVPEQVGPEGPDGVMYVVVCQDWEEDKGFVLWELRLELGAEELGRTLSVEELGRMREGRKWVHEASLLAKKQQTAATDALKDKTVSVRLGLSGQKRFAPRVGRAGEMKEIEPAQEGDTWVRIDGGLYEEITDRDGVKRSPSFVFTTEDAVVSAAYAALALQFKDA